MPRNVRTARIAALRRRASSVPAGYGHTDGEGAARQYWPAQYAIGAGAGPTSHLMFADSRMAKRDLPPMRRGQPAVPAMGLLGDGTQHPFRLPARIWQNMSPQEQELLRRRWSKMSPEQQRRAINAVQLRDSAAVRFQRRLTPPPKQAQPKQPPS